MGKYKISVIIPTYNAEKYLDDCIDSLLNQTFCFENLEVIMVDDSSSDSPPKILRDLSDRYENVTALFCSQNSGSPSKPRNIGIEAATSEYIMFLDNDDYYCPRMCEVMYESIVRENVDVVTCRLIFRRDNEEDIRQKSFLDDYGDAVKVDSVHEMPNLMSTFNTGFIKKIF